MSEIRSWADEHQFEAAPMDAATTESGMVIPKVRLLWMTPDPLGAVAAMCRMYVGLPTYDLATIDDEERSNYLDQIQKTHLKAPLEAVKLHFFIEGVTRSFTHQMVRQRTAVYSQESLRFAVKENFAAEASMPPSIAGLKHNDDRREMWNKALLGIQDTYEYLVANGIPAEDARGLLPHCTTTRLNYVTDLRNLIDHAGNRLCTQAQFEWRIVFMGIVDAIRNYNPEAGTRAMNDHAWQYRMIADSEMFRPVCYQLGKCQFTADFDRSCTIRERADRGAFDEIDPNEWLGDPAAARMTSGGGGHD
jgi:flavin-dependent thymidylate synthase